MEIRKQGGLSVYDLTGYRPGDIRLKTGCRIAKLRENSNAALAGMCVGGTIVSVNGFSTLGYPSRCVENMILLFSEQGKDNVEETSVEICTMANGLFDEIVSQLPPGLLDNRVVPLMFKSARKPKKITACLKIYLFFVIFYFFSNRIKTRESQ